MITNRVTDLEVKELIDKVRSVGNKVHFMFTKSLSEFLQSGIQFNKRNDLVIVDSNKDVQHLYSKDDYFKHARKVIYARRDTTATVSSISCVVRKAEGIVEDDIKDMSARAQSISLYPLNIQPSDNLYAIYENGYLIGYIVTKGNNVITSVYVEPWARSRGIAHFAINQVANSFVRTYGSCIVYTEDYGMVTPINILEQLCFNVQLMVINKLEI